MKMTKTTIWAKLETTNAQGHVTMYISFHRLIMSFLIHVLQYSWFHIIFAIASMYVAMLLTDW